MAVLKLVLIGLGGVGKSCLTIRFISHRFVEDYDPTLEDSYRKELVVDGEEVVLDIFDTAGQESFSAVRDQYIRECDGFLCIYSVTYAVSFKAVAGLHRHIVHVKEADNVPFMLVGNKCDLEGEREVTKKQGEELAKELGCAFMEASAKAEINVSEAFIELARLCVRFKKTQLPPPDKNQGKKKKEKGGGCILV